MKCPNCQATLLLSERKGIEIDYCPECRGVWLDRGELDKLMQQDQSYQAPVQKNDSYSRDSYSDSDRDKNYQRKHKKESFLGDLFDF